MSIIIYNLYMARNVPKLFKGMIVHHIRYIKNVTCVTF